MSSDIWSSLPCGICCRSWLPLERWTTRARWRRSPVRCSSVGRCRSSSGRSRGSFRWGTAPAARGYRTRRPHYGSSVSSTCSLCRTCSSGAADCQCTGTGRRPWWRDDCTALRIRPCCREFALVLSKLLQITITGKMQLEVILGT